VIEEFDQAVDDLLEPYRGHPQLELGARVVSNLSDYGFTWSLLAAAKGRKRGPARRRATRALALAGASSWAVNTAVKAAVKRGRPSAVSAESSESRLWVRSPTSSSFPSGHTLAAFCTAVVLADSPAESAVFLGFAGAVGASRVYLRAHHASDVLGGAVIGAGVGLLGRKLVRGLR
jgi:undecaprenyl-diphosphatase